MTGIAVGNGTIPKEEVAVGQEIVASVIVDNKESSEPFLKGSNCGGSNLDFKLGGEKVNVTLQVTDKDGNEVLRETEEVCAPYGAIGKKQREAKFNVTLGSPGRYNFSWLLSAPRNLVNFTNKPEPFSVVVREDTNKTDPRDENEGSNGSDNKGNKNLLKTAIENPVGTVVVVGGGAIALREAISVE